MITITNAQFLGGPNVHCMQSVLVIEASCEVELELLMAPQRRDEGRIAALEAQDGAAELVSLIRSALASLAPGSAAISLVLEIAARLQQRYVISGGTGSLLAQEGQGLRLFLPAEDERIGLDALILAIGLVIGLWWDRESSAPNPGQLLQRYREFAHTSRSRALDLLTIAVARRASELDIPVYRSKFSPNMIDLGQGPFRRSTYETLSASSNYIALSLTRNKWQTLQRLRPMGLPTLYSGIAASEQAAVALAKQIGHAVVLKPLDGAKGRGVSLNLTSEEQVRKAYRLAAAEGSNVLVESFAIGDDYRLLAVEGKLIAAAKRLPAQVFGDGQRTIAQLIEVINADPRRGTDYEKLLEKIQIDARMLDILARQAMTIETVPATGAVVRLSLAANISQGGTAVDVIDAVHPDVREAAERTAKAIGLEVLGIDYLTTDISKSWRDVGGWFLEVNAPPGLRPHWIANPDQDVVTPLVRVMFPEGAPSRIPTAGVTGSLGKTTTCQMIAKIAEADGRTPGLATTQGVWSGSFHVARGDSSGGAAASDLVRDPMVDIGIFELARGGLLKKGMQIDGVDVAAVLNVYDNHIGLDGISTREEMAAVKSILVKSARQWVFLNADDPLVMGMRELNKGVKIGLVSQQAANPLVAEHRQAGHCTVNVEVSGGEASLCLTDKSQVIFQLPLSRIPASLGGKADSIAANALFAAGIAYALGLPTHAIEQGLSGFTSDLSGNPGRHNWIEGFPFELLLHLADGVEAFADLVATLAAAPPEGLRHLYLTLPGNRSDDYIRAQARVVAGHFDRYYLTDYQDLRGRNQGEVPQIVLQELVANGVPADAISLLSPSPEDLFVALDQVGNGDRLAVITNYVDDAKSAIDRLRQRLADAKK